MNSCAPRDAGGLLDLRARGVRPAVGDVRRRSCRRTGSSPRTPHADLAAQRSQRDVRGRRARRPAPGPRRGRRSRWTSRVTVDLPLPLAPTRATRSPARTCRSRPSRTAALVVGEPARPGARSRRRHLGQLDGVGRVGDAPAGGRAAGRSARPRPGPAGRPSGRRPAGGPARRTGRRTSRTRGRCRSRSARGGPSSRRGRAPRPGPRTGIDSQQRLVARLQPRRRACATPYSVWTMPTIRAQLALLLAERLDDAHAVHVLVDDLGHLALALLAVPGRREDLAGASGTRRRTAAARSPGRPGRAGATGRT